METGERLKQRRLELGLTLEQVGDIVGVSKSTVRKWETGLIANMRRDRIALYAEALKVSPAFIIGVEEDPEAQREEMDLIELREEMRRKPGLRILFSLTKNASNEDIEAVAKLMEHFKGED